jgi:hypothetical protein
VVHLCIFKHLDEIQLDDGGHPIRFSSSNKNFGFVSGKPEADIYIRVVLVVLGKVYICLVRQSIDPLYSMIDLGDNTKLHLVRRFITIFTTAMRIGLPKIDPLQSSLTRR